MARFRGQIAYLRSTTRDVAFGTNVRAMLGTAGADTNFTITFTSTTAATQTVNPYTNISNVTADNRTTLGWAFNQNEASVDGVGSIATRKRTTPAGSWNFSNALSGSAPALLANYNVTLEYSIYRVAANGGARTLLFSFTGAPVNRTASGAFTYTASSPAQPSYTLEPDETLHESIRITSAATSSVLGGTTNTVITVSGATSGSQSVTLPAPGMRDLYFDTSTAIGEGAGSESILTRKDIFTGVGEGVGTYARLWDAFREFLSVGDGIADREMLTVMKFAQTIGKGVGTRSNFVRKDNILGIGEGVGTESILTRKDIFTGVGEGVGTYARKLELFRSFLGIGEGVGTESILTRKDIFTGVGEGVADLMRSVVFVREFLAVGDGIGDIAKSVIFVRDFVAVGKATIRPRISLDWDDLPDPGGGGGVIIENVFRPIFVFDD